MFYWNISDGEDFEPNEATNNLDDKWDGEDEDDDVAVRFLFMFFKSLCLWEWKAKLSGAKSTLLINRGKLS